MPREVIYGLVLTALVGTDAYLVLREPVVPRELGLCRADAGIDATVASLPPPASSAEPSGEPVDLQQVPPIDLYVEKMSKMRKECAALKAPGDPASPTMHTVRIGGDVWAECWSAFCSSNGYCGEGELLWSHWINRSTEP